VAVEAARKREARGGKGEKEGGRGGGGAGTAGRGEGPGRIGRCRRRGGQRPLDPHLLLVLPFLLSPLPFLSLPFPCDEGGREGGREGGSAREREAGAEGEGGEELLHHPLRPRHGLEGKGALVEAGGGCPRGVEGGGEGGRKGRREGGREGRRERGQGQGIECGKDKL